MSGKYKYHLSLKNGRGIARISGGSLNNQILCITNENEPNISGKGSEDNSTNFFNKSNDEIIKLLGQDFINKLLAGKKKRKLGHNDMSEFIEFIREKYGKSNEIKSSDVDSDSDSCSDVDSNSENSFCNGKISIINYKKSKKGTSDNKEKKSSSNGKGKVTKTSMDKAYDIAVNKLKNDE